MEDMVSLVPLNVRFKLIKESSHAEITDKVREYSSRVLDIPLQMMVEPDFFLA